MSNHNIYFSSPSSENDLIGEELNSSIRDIFSSQVLILGEGVSRFEKNFSNYIGSEYCVGLNSGTDALIISMKALGIGPGDEVITTNMSALATLASIVAVGATPVLVDVNDDMLANLKHIDMNITEKTKAVIYVHLYGDGTNAREISDLCDQNKIDLIEDCAQSAGSKCDDKFTGSFGKLSAFSFYPTKNLASIGDGGAVITSDEELFNKVKQIRQYGWDDERNPQSTGINSRLDEIQAKVLNVKLKHLNKLLNKRKEISSTYIEKLSEKYQLITKKEDIPYHLFVITVDNRDEVMSALEKENIFLGIHYSEAFSKMNHYKNLCKINYDLNISEKFSKEIVTLPIYPGLKSEEQARICDLLLNLNVK